MIFPEVLRSVLEAIRQAGGRPRLVGGCVRDHLLGLPTKDYDVEIGLLSFDALHRVLAPFGSTDVIGRSFGVIKLRIGAVEYDFSLPRRESKTGAGHRGFHVRPEPELDDASAAARRDFTINSIAYDPFSNRFIDPHGGMQDLKARRLKHTSEAFVEDPLRVLRAMQFAARFDLSLDPSTARLCSSIMDAHKELPVERIWGEWDKWATQSSIPSRALRVLAETNWIKHYPEIANLQGTPQEPEWHPEGDVFVHTQHCLDAMIGHTSWTKRSLNDRRVLSFSVLAHDFGKPSTTAYIERRGFMRWTSHGHEAAGGPFAEYFMHRIGAPRDLHEPVRMLVINHLLHHHQHKPGYSDTQIRRLARRLTPATIDDLCDVMKADAWGRPPMSASSSLVLIEELQVQAQRLSVRTQGPSPLLLGRHLLAEGLKAGPSFKAILDEAFEAQLDGSFNDESGAISWLRLRLSEGPQTGLGSSGAHPTA